MLIHVMKRLRSHFKKGLVALLVVFIIAGPVYAETVVQLQPFTGVINQLEQLVLQEKWEKALAMGTNLKKTYDKHLWKLQLLGDENEYEQLDNDIDHLIVLLKEKDKKESLIRLSIIRAELKHIYSL